MADIGGWRPVRGTHAIQYAIITITFSEPVNQKPLARVEQLITAAAQKAGISEKSAIQEFMMAVSPADPNPVKSSQSVDGYEFVRRAGATFIAEKLQFQRTQLHYELWDYTRWAPMLSRASELLEEAFKVCAEGVGVASIAAAYSDVFHGLQPRTSPDCAEIIRSDSPLVARNAFRNNDLWHTHTGWFETKSAWKRQLNQVNIDVAETNRPDGIYRLAHIHTTVQEQMNQVGQEAPPQEPTWADVVESLQTSHGKLKTTLGAVLTEEASKAISLDNA